MEWLDAIIRLISSVGFPSAVCCALLVYIFNVQSKLIDTITAMNSGLSANTKALEDLKDEVRK